MRVVLPEDELRERLGEPCDVSSAPGGSIGLADGAVYDLRRLSWACGCTAREDYPGWFGHRDCGDTSHHID